MLQMISATLPISDNYVCDFSTGRINKKISLDRSKTNIENGHTLLNKEMEHVNLGRNSGRHYYKHSS